MSDIRILHAADLHLDSPFEGLPASKAALRRAEQRELLGRLAELAKKEQVQLALLAGDLLDSDNSYYEPGEELARCLAGMGVPVFIAPGNHDYYTPKSPWARLKLPGNVCVFREQEIRGVTLPALGVRVCGAAFLEKHSGPLLRGFTVPQGQGLRNILVLHGEVGGRPDSPYDPITEEELAASGFDYVALGHIHRASGLKRAGKTWYAWPGCPEGRGFDETGEKTVNLVTLGDDGVCTLETRCIAQRRYEELRVDVTGADPLLAVHTLLPDETVRDVYRITLTGETEESPDLNRLRLNLEELFFALQLRDETRPREALWDRAGDDTLRGLFLKKLKAQYESAPDEQARRVIEQAARWGLAALDNREEVARHDDP